MLKKTLVFAAFVGFAFTVDTPTPAYAAGAKCTNHKHTGTGRGPSKKIAKLAARKKWVYGVLKHKHHPFMATWIKAAEKSYSCRRKYGVYKCRAQAYACKTSPFEPSGTGWAGRKRIGSSGFTNWCKKTYRNVRWAKLIGKTAGDWVCVMKNGSHKPISVKGACKLQYGVGQVYKAAALKWSDPYSWDCYLR